MSPLPSRGRAAAGAARGSRVRRRPDRTRPKEAAPSMAETTKTPINTPPKTPPGETPGKSQASGRGRERDEHDSFIEEVSEELRRDRLFAAFRRYGPYAIAAIVAAVIGTAVFNYLDDATTAQNRENGAALRTAAAAEDKVRRL